MNKGRSWLKEQGWKEGQKFVCLTSEGLSLSWF